MPSRKKWKSRSRSARRALPLTSRFKSAPLRAPLRAFPVAPLQAPPAAPHAPSLRRMGWGRNNAKLCFPWALDKFTTLIICYAALCCHQVYVYSDVLSHFPPYRALALAASGLPLPVRDSISEQILFLSYRQPRITHLVY
jgi:hypothetical protein